MSDLLIVIVFVLGVVALGGLYGWFERVSLELRDEREQAKEAKRRAALLAAWAEQDRIREEQEQATHARKNITP